MKGKRLVLIVVLMLLASLLLVSVVYAKSKSQQGAGPYLVTEDPVLSGPPTVVNGKTIIAGTVSNVGALGTIVGTFAINFTCVLGVDGKPNKCEGVQTITGTVDGSAAGTFQNALKWTAGGDAAFTDGKFKLIKGSGTGGLVNLDKFKGTFQRDEDAGPNGIYSGDFRFK